MKRANFKRLTAIPLLFPLLFLLAGCYTPPGNSGPNIPAEKRVQLPGEYPQNPVNVGGNASNPPVTPPAGTGSEGGKAAIGDRMTIFFSDIPLGQLPAQMEVKVSSDGTISLPHSVVIRAVGKTSTEIQREIHSAYVPSLFVMLTAIVKFEDRYFYIGGEVKNPQRQFYTGTEMTVLRAIETAQGYTDFANKKKIEVRRATGKTEWVNGVKARANPALDLPVYPNDHITVKRKWL